MANYPTGQTILQLGGGPPYGANNYGEALTDFTNLWGNSSNTTNNNNNEPEILGLSLPEIAGFSLIGIVLTLATIAGIVSIPLALLLFFGALLAMYGYNYLTKGVNGLNNVAGNIEKSINNIIKTLSPTDNTTFGLIIFILIVILLGIGGYYIYEEFK
jgi:hypothetical protein